MNKLKIVAFISLLTATHNKTSPFARRLGLMGKKIITEVKSNPYNLVYLFYIGVLPISIYQARWQFNNNRIAIMENDNKNLKEENQLKKDSIADIGKEINESKQNQKSMQKEINKLQTEQKMKLKQEMKLKQGRINNSEVNNNSKVKIEEEEENQKN
jgi:hypothetical protein